MAMRLGKLRENVRQRSVEKQLHKNLNRYKTASHSDALVLSRDPAGKWRPVCAACEPVQGWLLAADRLVSRSVCAAAADRMISDPETGIYLHLHVSILLPEGTEEPDFKALIHDMDQKAFLQDFLLHVDYAAVSPAVSTLLVQAQVHGFSRILREEEPHGRKKRPDWADMDICMVGELAPEGTAMIAAGGRQQLVHRYSRDFIRAAEDLFSMHPFREMRSLLMKSAPEQIHVLGEGGVFGGLWELAAGAGTGLHVDLKRIPVRQHTIELSEYFRINPYQLHSGGAILLLSKEGEDFVNLAGEYRVRAAVIGRTIPGRDRTISYDGEIRYLEPPGMDEIYKLFNHKDGGIDAKRNIKNAGE